MNYSTPKTMDVNLILGAGSADVYELDSGYSLVVLCYQFDEEKFLRMLDWATQNNIIDLSLEDCKIDNVYLGHVLAHTLAQKLSILYLRDNLLNYESAKQLANSSSLYSLLELDVGENYITDSGVSLIISALATSLPKLSVLGISCTGVDTTALRQLLDSPSASRIQRLDLEQTEIEVSIKNELISIFSTRVIF